MNIVFTMGCSTKTSEEFISKLKEFGINLLVDVRTSPYSRWASNFNKEEIEILVKDNGIAYLYRGKNLGGLGENVDFDLAIEEVVRLSEHSIIAIMCSEADYTKCHRYKILTPKLVKAGVKVEHIVWNNITHLGRQLSF